MKHKLIIGAVMVSTVVLVGGPAASAVAQQPTAQSSSSDIPDTLPTCGFQIDVVKVADERKITDTTLRNGDVVERTTGKLVLRFTNHLAPIKSIVKDVSGPTIRITHADDTGVFVGAGKNWIAIGPTGQKNTGQPGLVFTSGLVTLTFTGNIINKFSVIGHLENGCALLAS